MTNQSSFKTGIIVVVIPSCSYGYFLPEALSQFYIKLDLQMKSSVSLKIILWNWIKSREYLNSKEYNGNETNLGWVENVNKGVSLKNVDYINFWSTGDGFRSDYIGLVSEVLVSDHGRGDWQSCFSKFLEIRKSDVLLS